MVTPQEVLKFLHVVAAAVVLGYLALVPMWRASVKRSGELAVLKNMLQTMRDSQNRLVLPSVVVLILTGLLMTYGPFLIRGFSILLNRQMQAGLLLSLALGFVLYSGLLGPIKKMMPLVEAGEPEGPAMDKLWSEWRTSLIMASLLALVATGLMVWRFT